MVELSRSFIRERLQRTPTAAALVSVPAVPRVPDESGAMLRASATFTEGLAALGQSLSAFAARERQLAYAQDVAKTGEAVGQFQLGMAPLQQRMLETQVPALERPAYLRQHGEALIQTLAAGVPERMQPQFTAQATQDLARFVLAEQSAASRQFVSEQQQALPAVLDLVGRQLVGADDRQRPAILASLTAIGTSYAEAGIVSAPLAQALVRETVDRQDTIRTQQQIMANPAAMQQHLRDLSAGKPGTPGLPVPPAKDLADLTRQANQQVGQDLALLDREERQSEAKLRQTQDANMVRLQGRLYDPEISAQQVQRVQQEATTLAEQRQLSKEDHAQVMRETRTLTQTLQQGPAVTAPAAKIRILGRLYGGDPGGSGLDALREDVLQGMLDGQINLKDGTDWLKEIANQRQANYYTKIPAYDEGREFLQVTVNYLSKMSFLPNVNKKAVEEMQSRTAYALQLYSERIRDVWQRDGVRGVEAQAAPLAREVQTYFGVTPLQVLQHFPPPTVLTEAQGTTVEERYTDAARRLQAMDLPESERANQYRLLQERKVIELQVERNNPAPPATPSRSGTTPAPAQAPAPQGGAAPQTTPGQTRSQRTGQTNPYPPGSPKAQQWERGESQ